jgi:undecaprenyl-diphosphatase
MGVFEGVWLGVLQGLTEFLPVSSDGHLLLAKSLLPGTAHPGHAFDVAVHFGTLLATLTMFRRELRPLAAGVPRLVRACTSPAAFRARYADDPAVRYLVLFAASAIPAGAAGLLFDDAIDAMNARPALLAPFFAATGIWLVLTRWARPGRRAVGMRDAWLIGAAQAVAILPGVSRSALTLGAGLFLRIERGSLGSFAFLMSLVPIAGAVLLKARHLGSASAPLVPTLAGVVAAYVSGLVAIKVLMPFIHRGKLAGFGWYVLAVAAFCFVRFDGA